jgi:predicted MFS family arabinose efflux permease
VISDAFGWRSAFAILAVVAFAKALLLFIYLPKTSLHQHQVSCARSSRSCAAR